MPIFARRRSQAMLDDLGPRLTAAKDLLVRLEHKDSKLALAAEFELGLLWGISRVADLKIAPELPDSRARPDAFSKDLFDSDPAVIEITALSDDTFSGQADMDRAANIMAQFADRIRRGAAEHLHFEFQENNFCEGGRYHRVRRITPDFKLTPSIKSTLQDWLTAPDWPAPPAIRLTNDQIDVAVHWKKMVLPLFRAHSSMPAVAYDLEDNHLFKALRKKERRQLSSTPSDALKCIFLGDAGCRILRHLRPMGVAETNGDQIIRHFLALSSVDVVCVFSPHTSNGAYPPSFSSRFWTITICDRRQPPQEAQYARLHALANSLPRPKFEGSQARSLHRQGMFHPQASGQYLATYVTSGPFSMTIKLSSRLVQELLAGRLSQKQFSLFAFGKDKNLFDLQLARGFMIKSVRVEDGGIDDDDDHIVFEFGPDSAAMPLRKPETVRVNQGI